MSGAGARRGFNRETIFVNLINNDMVFRNKLINALHQLTLIEGEILSAEDVKRTCKSDVILEIRDHNRYELGCSLKAAEANFNQLDRRWLSDWANVLMMPNHIKEMIQSSLDRKRLHSRDIFILPEQEPFVLPFLESSKERIFRELFTRDDENLNVFVAYDESHNEWFIARIDDIINVLLNEPITTSSNGVVKIGNCLSLQRKGGDGNITNPPKSSPLHPSNQLQFKIKPLSIINMVSSIVITE